jgi:hypothetical protein
MKNILLSLLMLIAVNGFTQWQADVRLSNNSSLSWITQNNTKSIAASVTTVHVVWQDNRDGNWEIYYLRSPDNGISWGSETRLTNNSSTSELPTICADGLNVHIVWQDSRDGNTEIYYKKSVNGGLNWGTDTRLTFNSSASTNPSITIFSTSLNIVWQDNTSGNNEIYSYYSTNNGTNWSSFIRLTNNTSSSEKPCINRNGQGVYCVWQDNRDGNYEIYSKRSIDGGVTWSSDSRVTNNSGNSKSASVAGSGTNIAVVWKDDRDGNEEIYMNSSINYGIYWGTDKRLTNNVAGSDCPSIAVSGNTLQVVWHDSRDNSISEEIYYKRSPDFGVSWGSDTRLTTTPAFKVAPSVAISGTTVHVVWEDHREGMEGEIYYKRDPTGNPIGIRNISTEIPEKYSLMQNYPNPFNPSTIIKFDVARFGEIKISVFDAAGREVQTLVNENVHPGKYEVTFEASSLNSGVYFYRIQSREFSETKRMILIK